MEVMYRWFSPDHKYLYVKYSDGSISGEPITEEQYLKLLPELYE